MDRYEIDLLGESFFALASRALWWPKHRTVFVADIHLGKAAAFRERSLPLPHGTTAASLFRLSRLLEETSAERMIVLGDLWHDRLGQSESVLEALSNWTDSHPGTDFVLITGNHDRKFGKTPDRSGFQEVDELCLDQFCCLHHPNPREGMYVLCGHIHPGFTFRAARTGVQVPCFWFGESVAVLPAFGEFTGLATIDPCPGDKLVLVAGEEVVPLVSARL